VPVRACSDPLGGGLRVRSSKTPSAEEGGDLFERVRRRVAIEELQGRLQKTKMNAFATTW